jgi:ABC-type lipoprotein export system ATPase subunit
MNDSAPILIAQGIKKAYAIGDRRLEVLRGVDVTVSRGEFLALRGSSGAGKSTLLHLFGGLDLPDSGSIEVLNHRLTSMGGNDLARFRNQRIGFIFQAYHLLPELTALENVLLSARIARTSYAKAQSNARSLLERVGLGSRLDHRPSQLSGGEQQRVGIARALVNEPQLILADEPTGNLDTSTGREVMDILLNLRAERNATLIIATHDLGLASKAERVIMLTDGRISD